MIDFPRLNSIQKIIAILVTLATICAGGVYALWHYSETGKKKPAQIATLGSMDPSYFATPKIQQPEPTPEPPKDDAKTRGLPPPPAAPSSAPPVPSLPEPPKPLRQAEIFRTTYPVGQDKDPALLINAKRRGHTVVEFLDDQANSKVSLAEQSAAFRRANSSKKWDEERTEASLPVDMSRVVNVAKFIPALLENEINSELPGKVVATIEENVYGSHGRLVLIPGGSKAVGRYRPLGKQGERRIGIIWERIITYPDGIDIPLVDAEMSDAMGRSGITGDLDNRFMDRYGMALFVSVLGALAQTQIPVDNRAAGIAVDSIGNSSASLAKTILDKNIDLKPIVTIPQGSRITISAQRDVWFKPALDGKVEAVALTDRRKK